MRTKYFLFLIVLVATIGPANGSTQAQLQANSPRKTSTPYSGDLSIFDSPGRENRLQIERVMDILKIIHGSVVADVGAGSGWFTVRAAKRVGTHGQVYAVDINPDAITYIQKRGRKNN